MSPPPPRRRRGLVLLLAAGLLAFPVRAEEAPSGTWAGTYRCGQGETALTLILRPGAGEGAVDGLFHFHGTPGNPGVPEGCFTMSGSFGNPAGELRLSARRWLLQPFGYVSVNLAGHLLPDGATLAGRVEGPLCRGFSLRRTRGTAAPVPSACFGSAPVAAIQP